MKDTSVGIICLTRENLHAPWILFEAGGLSRGLAKQRVIPLLIDLELSDLRSPLSEFNAALPNEKDMLRLVKTINDSLKSAKLTEKKLDEAFDMWWPRFDESYMGIMASQQLAPAPAKRSDREIAEETLEVTRSVQKMMQEIAHANPFALTSGISVTVPARIIPSGSDYVWRTGEPAKFTLITKEIDPTREPSEPSEVRFDPMAEPRGEQEEGQD
jgi:hypothetical protein